MKSSVTNNGIFPLFFFPLFNSNRYYDQFEASEKKKEVKFGNETGSTPF